MTIIKVQMFDPALSGDETLPVRLELITDFMHDKPRDMVQTPDWIALDYDPFWSFARNDESDNELPDVGLFNISGVLSEPLVPVTVTVGGAMWLEWYAPYSRVKQWVRRIDPSEYPWQVVPNVPSLLDGKIEFRFVNSSKACVRCMSSGQGYYLGYQEVELTPKRLGWLCRHHTIEWNSMNAARRIEG